MWSDSMHVCVSKMMESTMREIETSFGDMLGWKHAQCSEDVLSENFPEKLINCSKTCKSSAICCKQNSELKLKTFPL